MSYKRVINNGCNNTVLLAIIFNRVPKYYLRSLLFKTVDTVISYILILLQCVIF